MFLPEKKSLNWIAVFIVVAIINMGALIGTRSMMGVSSNFEAFQGYAFFSLMLAFISIFGYFGYRLLSIVVLATDLIGIGYLFYVALANPSPGWNDLTSMAGFMAIMGFGVLVGAIIEFVVWLMAIKKKKSKK
jgi:hypothetical protein